MKELDAALAGKPLSLHAGFNPVGEWRCRTMKLGGGLPLVVYPWFNCRISEDGVGWRLDKLSGSQRTSGRFYDRSDTELVYLGVSWVSGEPKVSYGEDAPRDQVARVTRPAEDRLVFEFPKPALESDFDILELKRGR